MMDLYALGTAKSPLKLNKMKETVWQNTKEFRRLPSISHLRRPDLCKPKATGSFKWVLGSLWASGPGQVKRLM